jgi:hypothetical protein
MEHPDSKDITDKGVAGASADNSESPTTSTTMRPSAIERQIAATSGLSDPMARRAGLNNTTHRKPNRFGLVSFLLLVLIVAVLLALLFTDRGRPLRKTISSTLPVAGQVVRNDSLPATHLSPTISPPQTTNPSPASASQTSANTSTASTNAATFSTPDAISIPVTDVSLRNRPELLEQLVQIYRSKLTGDPNNSTARTALSQLQERSLSELQTIVLEGDDATAVKSLEIVARLFPEVVDNARYKYLVARMDRIHRQVKDEPAAKPEPSPPPSTTSPPATISPEKSVSPSINSLAAGVKKTAENAPSSKPEIRALSITPGTLVDDRFVPSEDGNVFMVEISYRNFDKISEDSSGASLVALLGVPGNATVLAEVPVEILGDRGTKSFVMATLTPGNTGGKYQLNFILNGEFLASRTVRLSMPER